MACDLRVGDASSITGAETRQIQHWRKSGLLRAAVGGAPKHGTRAHLRFSLDALLRIRCIHVLAGFGLNPRKAAEVVWAAEVALAIALQLKSGEWFRMPDEEYSPMEGTSDLDALLERLRQYLSDQEPIRIAEAGWPSAPLQNAPHSPFVELVTHVGSDLSPDYSCRVVLGPPEWAVCALGRGARYGVSVPVGPKGKWRDGDSPFWRWVANGIGIAPVPEPSEALLLVDLTASAQYVAARVADHDALRCHPSGP